MVADVLKWLAAFVLFAAWGAIVFTGKTNVPGAETLIAWIQGALAVLIGIHFYGAGARSKSGDAPQDDKEQEQ